MCATLAMASMSARSRTVRCRAPLHLKGVGEVAATKRHRSGSTMRSTFSPAPTGACWTTLSAGRRGRPNGISGIGFRFLRFSARTLSTRQPGGLSSMAGNPGPSRSSSLREKTSSRATTLCVCPIATSVRGPRVPQAFRRFSCVGSTMGPLLVSSRRPTTRMRWVRATGAWRANTKKRSTGSRALSARSCRPRRSGAAPRRKRGTEPRPGESWSA